MRTNSEPRRGGANQRPAPTDAPRAVPSRAVLLRAVLAQAAVSGLLVLAALLSGSTACVPQTPAAPTPKVAVVPKKTPPTIAPTTKPEPKTLPKTEPKTLPKTEPRTEPKTLPKTEPRTEPKTLPKTEPKTEVKKTPPAVEVVAVTLERPAQAPPFGEEIQLYRCPAGKPEERVALAVELAVEPANMGSPNMGSPNMGSPNMGSPEVPANKQPVRWKPTTGELTIPKPLLVGGPSVMLLVELPGYEPKLFKPVTRTKVPLRLMAILVKLPTDKANRPNGETLELRLTRSGGAGSTSQQPVAWRSQLSSERAEQWVTLPEGGWPMWTKARAELRAPGWHPVVVPEVDAARPTVDGSRMTRLPDDGVVVVVLNNYAIVPAADRALENRIKQAQQEICLELHERMTKSESPKIRSVSFVVVDTGQGDWPRSLGNQSFLRSTDAQAALTQAPRHKHQSEHLWRHLWAVLDDADVLQRHPELRVVIVTPAAADVGERELEYQRLQESLKAGQVRLSTVLIGPPALAGRKEIRDLYPNPIAIEVASDRNHRELIKPTVDKVLEALVGKPPDNKPSENKPEEKPDNKSEEKPDNKPEK